MRRPRAERLPAHAALARTLSGGGALVYDPSFLSAHEAERALAALLAEAPLAERTIRLFGRDVREPRRSAWLGVPEAVYTYSGVTHAPSPFTPTAAALRDRLERELCARFNAVLVNHYRDGRDSMGFHADDEPELGPAPTIASVSLGGPRRFLLRPRRGEGEALDLELASGSLLVMSGPLQRTHVHAVPKERAAEPRVNLTFRWIEPGRARASDKGLTPAPEPR